MKVALFCSIIVSTAAFAAPVVLSQTRVGHVPTGVPVLKFEYSYGLDMNCPEDVVPEALTPSQKALIPKIPLYRDQELLSKLSWFQSEWDRQGAPLLVAARNAIGKTYPMSEIPAALFLCPRFPSMGTPLALNVISYLHSSAKDIPYLAGRPMPVFFFISTVFHEVLHKFINSVLQNRTSLVLKALGTDSQSLYGAHLHLFALQKKVFIDLDLAHLLPAIERLEASHGPEYVRAWNKVHQEQSVYEALLDELRD